MARRPKRPRHIQPPRRGILVVEDNWDAAGFDHHVTKAEPRRILLGVIGDLSQTS